MDLVDEVRKHKYVGMPFHSPKWPSPVYSHLAVSDDGFNWTNLKNYNFGWRDTDLHYINGLWWACYTTAICYSTDLETFTEIPTNFKFQSVWAPELFKDKDGQWYLIYCGGNGKDDSWSIYVNKFYPDEKRLDDKVTKININENEHWIDANLNYIDGYYYLWTCCTSHDPHELRLYKSSSLLGTYERVQTNINDRVKDAGMLIDEAPEMDYRDGRYILYSDPYYHGLPELDRCVQYSISTDMIDWSNLTKLSCTGNYNPRHFSPLKIGENILIISWDGNPGTLEITNQNNFQSIVNLISRINELAKTNSIFLPIKINLDTEILMGLNRGARNQFLNNAAILNTILPDLFNDYRYATGDAKDLQKRYQQPNIPTSLNIDKDEINAYWDAVDYDLGLVIKAINKGGQINGK